MSPPDAEAAVAVADLPMPAALIDAAGHLVDVSMPFAALTGRERSGLQGAALVDLVAPEDRGRLATACTGAGQVEVEVAGRRDDGLPFVLTLAVPAPDDGGARLVTANRRGPPTRWLADGADPDEPDGRDIIDSALSHDVRGALRGVGGFLSVLDRGGRVSEDDQAYLDTARRSAAAADAMAERLVEFSRLGRRPLLVDRVDLSDVLSSVLDDLDDEQAVEVTAGELPTVVANRTLLEVVVQELLTNAAKFGAVAVDVSARIDGDWCYLRFEDDGPGIDAELRVRAFDLFKMLQPKGRYPGVGAGLAIVRRVAEVHGGAAWIEPGRPGGAAVVTRWLVA